MADKSTLERLVDDESRREFMKKGMTATAVAGLGATGVASAQEDGDDGGVSLTEGWKGLIFVNNFHPGATFTFVSGVVKWNPNYGGIDDSIFSNYNTRMIKWLNTGEVVPLFVAQDANVGEFNDDFGFVTDVDDDPNQPQLFQMNKEWTPFSDNPNLITVNVSPVGEEEEDRILQDEDWWQDQGQNGGGGTDTGGGNSTDSGGGNSTDSGGDNNAIF